jgi:anti-sigma B factor antagonist
MNISMVEKPNSLVLKINSKTLGSNNAQDFKSSVSKFLVPEAALVFDLSSLEFVDSTGLGTLISCLRQVNAAGGSIKLCGLTKPVRALFELVRMHRVFEIFNDAEEAANSYSKSRTTSA